MYSIFVAIKVKTEHIDEFSQVSITEGKGAVRDEPDCFRFEILNDSGDPTKFYFYEVFRTEEAAEAHWETENFKVWRKKVDHMVDGPFGETVEMKTVFPSNSGYEQQKPGLLSW